RERVRLRRGRARRIRRSRVLHVQRLERDARRVVGADVARGAGRGLAVHVALVGRRAGAGVARVERRAAELEGAGLRGAAVRGERGEVRVDAELVAVDAVDEAGAGARGDQVVARVGDSGPCAVAVEVGEDRVAERDLAAGEGVDAAGRGEVALVAGDRAVVD